MSKNILISGWPGAGVTTITLLLSYMLERKFLRGTESFRYIWKELGLNATGTSAASAERMVQPFYGRIFDKYIDSLLIKPQGLIIETDIGGFRVGKNENAVSFFVIADEHIRVERLSNDGRPEDAKVREIELRREYKKLHGFDWFDLETVKEKHDFVIDNSTLSITKEMTEVFAKLLGVKVIDNDEYKLLLNRLPELERLYWEKGKSWFSDEVTKKQLVITGVDTIKNIRSQFLEEIKEFPETLKQIILNA